MDQVNLSYIKKAHFTGIKGVGMTSLACIAKDFNIKITGSDVKKTFITDKILSKKKINWSSGFSDQKIINEKPDLLIYTAAHEGENNPEVKKAQGLKIPVLSQAQALGKFFHLKKTGITVCGVGGKTTTTAFLASVLTKSNYHPSYMIGVGRIPSLPFPGKFDPKGDIFISEGDEYKSSIKDQNPKFFYQNPKIIIIPNLAFDHPDIYKNEADTLNVFTKFVNKLPQDGALIINTDSKLASELLKKIKTQAQILSYGTNSGKYKIKNIKNHQFNLLNKKFTISLTGNFNIKNAAAVILACYFLKLDFKIIQNNLKSFTGLERRFQFIYKKNQTYIYDDYAHHPVEIKKTLKAFRQKFPNHKITVIFQSHTFSRTIALLEQFSQSFTSCNQVIIYPIFTSAREDKDQSFSEKDFVKKINQNSANAIFLNSDNKIIEYLKKQNLKKNVIITMGAGNVYEIIPQIKVII